MANVVVWFQVPTADNDKVPHARQLWTALETDLLVRFGGLTRGHNVAGAWRDETTGTVYREPSRTYEVDVPEDRLFETLALLQGACATFKQFCLRVKIGSRAFYLAPV